MRLGSGRTAMVKHLAAHGRLECVGQTTVAARQHGRDQQHVIATNKHTQTMASMRFILKLTAVILRPNTGG